MEFIFSTRNTGLVLFDPDMKWSGQYHDLEDISR